MVKRGARAAFLLCALSALVACEGRGTAREALEHSGYTNVEVGDKAAGAYPFYGTGPNGYHCEGTIKLAKSGNDISAHCNNTMHFDGRHPSSPPAVSAP